MCVCVCVCACVHRYDCDEFTKEFYRVNFNITDFTPIQIKQPPPSLVKQVRVNRIVYERST